MFSYVHNILVMLDLMVVKVYGIVKCFAWIGYN